MQKIIEWFDRAAKYYAAKHAREIAQAQLYRMTDRELRDIGIPRASIRYMV